MNANQLILAAGGLALLFFWWRRSGNTPGDGLSQTNPTGTTPVSPVTLNVNGPTIADQPLSDGLGQLMASSGLGWLASADSDAFNPAAPTPRPTDRTTTQPP